MYAKFINEDLIEIAPLNKNGIFNYNINEKLLRQDGYKKLVELEKPSEYIEPMQKYRELENSIEKYWIETYIEPTLEELKLKKRAEINHLRDVSEQNGFEYMGKTFDSDVVSCIRIQGAAQSMQALAMTEETPTITWTTKDNSTVELTAQELLGLSVALAEWSNTCHQKATALKAKIDAAQTAEELELITWDDNQVTLL